MYWNLPSGDTRLVVLGRDIKYISRSLSHLLYSGHGLKSICFIKLHSSPQPLIESSSLYSRVFNIWETNDSDVDINDDEEPLSTFDRLMKGFLLTKPTCRKSREPIL
jgi:hypothetical protein